MGDGGNDQYDKKYFSIMVTKCGIPQDAIGFSSNSASVMTGKCNSILSDMLQHQPKVLALLVFAILLPWLLLQV